MSEEKKSTAGWGTVVAVVTVITLMGVIFFWLKGCELYIGGVIFRDVRALAGMTFEIIMFIWIILASALSFKKIKDEKERKKMRGSIIAVSIVMLAMLGFMAWIVAGDVERSGKAAIAETDIGEGQSLLLAENEEKFSTSGESFYEITVYCRKGIRLKKIGGQDEYYFAHNNMVKNGQYRVERKGDTVTVYYDYGELINGLKWKEEYSDDPPEYIDKNYSLK